MLLLAKKGKVTSKHALNIANKIRASNPRHITTKIINEFTQKIARVN